MKKSTIVIVLGIFIGATAFLGINTNKMYQKQKHFETTSEVLQQIDNKSLEVVDKKGNIVESKELKECLSERKRLTDSQFNYGKIEIDKVEELNLEQKQSILKDYEELRNKFTMRRVITKEEVVRLDVKTYHSNIIQGKMEYTKPIKLKIDLVLVDEGEGLVIDYMMTSSPENIDKEGNENA